MSEHPEIIRIDEEAQAALEFRRKVKRPHKPGWWRNRPNPFTVGNKIKDEEL
ncbi:hypothetical protein JIN85_19815 [Luteolibacter pohnpeiensis]|uniref:Uncharacterized protein n=1 Tax=Luteolibacter pohnpeiensis TaxID=454153 RepID=A0A934SA64_9BACT|nr:hypothetical protein [Luteolibacter pohnpeiensis]